MAGATFAPQTGRGPEVGPRAASAQLPFAQRLYQQHEKKYAQAGCGLISSSAPGPSYLCSWLQLIESFRLNTWHLLEQLACVLQ